MTLRRHVRADVCDTCRNLLCIFSSSSTDFFSFSFMRSFCCHGSRLGFTCRTESKPSESTEYVNKTPP